jgi:hypothetical protein
VSQIPQTREEAEALAQEIRSGKFQGQAREEAMNSWRAWRDQAHAVARNEAEAAPDEDQNYFDKLGDAIEKRQLMLTDVLEATANGEQGYASGVLQVAGKYGAGLVGDFIGQSLMSAGSTALEVGDAITPDWATDPVIDTAKKAGTMLLNTDAAQSGIEAAKEGLEVYQAWKEENPVTARNLESTVNIGLLLAPLKGGKKVEAGIADDIAEAGARTGDRLRVSADLTEQKARDRFFERLLEPTRTAKVNQDIIRRTEQVDTRLGRLLNIQKPVATAAEKSSMQALRGVAGLSPKKSWTQNHNIIDKAIRTEGKKLETLVGNSRAKFQVSDLTKRLEDVKQSMKANPTLSVDGANAAGKLIDDFMVHLGKQGKFTAGAAGPQGNAVMLLKARKALDAEFRRANRAIQPDKMLGQAENGQNLAMRTLRTEINKFVDELVPGNSTVRNSLARQRALYNALDNVAPKAWNEGSNAIKRAWTAATKFLPIRSEASQMLALASGVGGLGAAALFAPAISTVALTGMASYGMGRAVSSPMVRRLLARVIDDVSKAPKGAREAAEWATEKKILNAYLVHLNELMANQESEGYPTRGELEDEYTKSLGQE